MTTPEALADRYGRNRSKRAIIAWWVSVAVVAAGTIGYFGWTTVATNINAVAVDNVGYTVVDHNTVSVSFQYTAPRGKDVTCALEAYDQEHGVVGYKILRYPGAESHGQKLTTDIRTVANATNGLVAGCWVS